MNVTGLKISPAPLACKERKFLTEGVRESIYSDLNENENFVFIVWDTIIHGQQFHCSTRVPLADMDTYLFHWRPNVALKFKDIESYLDKKAVDENHKKHENLEDDVIVERIEDVEP